jgi:holin-like protein
MKYLKQFCIILAISFVGELLHTWIPLPIPASIYGILILFIGLCTRWIPLDSVKETGKFLIDIMPVMFIPAAVGLINSWELIRSSWIPYLVVAVVTTVAVMAVAGRTTQYVMRHDKKKKTEEKEINTEKMEERADE